MAELDNLTLTIKAKSESADKALTNLSQALGRLSNSLSAVDKGGKTTQPFQRIVVHSTKTSNSINNLGNSFSRLNSKLKSFNGGSKNFAQRAGLFYAKCFLMIRGFKQLGRSIESATDYIEQYNYFNTTFQKIASESKNDFAKYGYDNADDYADSFQKRIKEKLGKMTGFNIGDNGVLSSTNMKNLGLDITQMTNYSASVAQLTNSIGLSGEASEVTSQAMAMLAGDMSSFKNIGMEQVMQNFTSGLSGSTMALRKYGIDLSVASLKQTALNYGVTKNVTTMSQAEKVQLRMLTILKQSRVAWGDLSKTINSSANQFRVWQNNMQTLSRELGSMFLPLISKVMPYVNAFAIALQRLLGYIASFLGIDLSSIMDESGEGFSDLGEDVLDLSDNMGDATKSAKKLKAQLMGFDNLNVITTPTDSSKNGKDTTPIDLTDELIEAFSDYEKIWNREYEKMQSKAQDFADKLTETFKKAWQSGDGSDIGSAIAKWLNKGIKWVNDNGSTFDKGMQKIASVLSTSLNGFIRDFGFDGFGKAIGDRLRSILASRNFLFDNTDWQGLGSGLATSLNSFVDSGAIQEYLAGFGSKIRSAIEFAFGTIKTFKFKNFGKALGEGLNKALSKLTKVDEKTGLNGFQKLGQTISDGLIGLEDTIITALDTVDWDVVGQGIADFIGKIDFLKIFTKSIEVFYKIAKAFGSALFTAFTENPIQFTELMLTIKAFSFAGSIKNTLATSLMSSLGGGGIDLGGKTIGLKNASFALKGGSNSLLSYLVAADIGAELGKSFCEYVNDYEFTWGEFFQGLKDWKLDLTDKVLKGYTTEQAFNNGFTGVEDMEKTLDRYGITLAQAEDIFKNFYKGNKQDIAGMLIGDASNAWNAINNYKGKKSSTSDIVIEAKTKLKLEQEERQKFKDKVKEWSEKNLNVYSGAKLRKDAVSGFKEEFAGKMLNYKYPLNVKPNGTAMNEYQKALQTYASTHPLTLKATLSIAAMELKNGKTSSIIFDEKTGFSHTIYGKANGGIFSGGRWHDIAKYASGGLPNKGQYFIAREAGPELVGKIGNNTAVMNNDQIVSSVASGVASAVASVIQPMLVNNGNNGDIVVQIDGETVFRAVKKQGNMYSKRTGRPAFE